MLFFNFFQPLSEKNVLVRVELKNDIELVGNLQSVDQYLNVKLNNVKVGGGGASVYPQFASLKNCFIRGSVVRYIHLAKEHVDLKALQDKCRRELAAGATK